MKISLFRIIAVVIATIGLLASLSMAQNREAPVSPFEIDSLENSKAPDFTLRDINGRVIKLSSLNGKVVLLNFWATWCPPCKAEMPSLNRLYAEMQSSGLVVIAVSTDKSAAPVREFLGKNHLDFTVLWDEKLSVTKQYKVFSMPTTFLIDRKGMIVEKFMGEYEWTDEEIKKKIRKL